MKILIVSQYFWPENFRINDLATGLKEKGNEIHVLTGKPNYPSGEFFKGYNFFNKSKENWNGIIIHRSPLFPRGNGRGYRLAVNYLSFSFFSMLRLLFIKERYDFVFVYQPSPITVGIPAVIIAKKLKIPIYFWVQDLWPESVLAAGQIKNKVILKWLNKLTKWVYKNSKYILIQSKGFKEFILKQGVKESKIIYYPNSTELLYNIVTPSKKILNIISQFSFSVMFAGNIGESQDFENIMETAKILINKNKNIHFIILGDGRKKDYVTKKIEEYKLISNFHLLGSFPVEDMPSFFACADALLVSLKKSDIFSLTIPSKVQSYLACGKPIIGALDGEVIQFIEEYNCGYLAPAGNPEILSEKILKMYKTNKSERTQIGMNSRRYFEENFEREMLLDKLINIFKN